MLSTKKYSFTSVRMICLFKLKAMLSLQTLEPRNNFTTRFTQILAAGAHFVETTFPTTPTLFPSTYTVKPRALNHADHSVAIFTHMTLHL